MNKTIKALSLAKQEIIGWYEDRYGEENSRADESEAIKAINEVLILEKAFADAYKKQSDKLEEEDTFGYTRDTFAASAMNGIFNCVIDDGNEPNYKMIAKDSYKMADAMMEARKS